MTDAGSARSRRRIVPERHRGRGRQAVAAGQPDIGSHQARHSREEFTGAVRALLMTR